MKPDRHFIAAEQMAGAAEQNNTARAPLALIKQVSLHSWKVRAATALVGLLTLAPIAVCVADGQTSLLQITALAQGASPEHNLNLHVQGPSDILQSLLTFQPGGDTGWHTHPGPVVVVVKTGALTEIHSNGCVTVHPAGTSFFESKDEVQ